MNIHFSLDSNDVTFMLGIIPRLLTQARELRRDYEKRLYPKIDLQIWKGLSLNGRIPPYSGLTILLVPEKMGSNEFYLVEISANEESEIDADTLYPLKAVKHLLDTSRGDVINVDYPIDLEGNLAADLALKKYCLLTGIIFEEEKAVGYN